MFFLRFCPFLVEYIRSNQSSQQGKFFVVLVRQHTNMRDFSLSITCCHGHVYIHYQWRRASEQDFSFAVVGFVAEVELVLRGYIRVTSVPIDVESDRVAALFDHQRGQSACGLFHRRVQTKNTENDRSAIHAALSCRDHVRAAAKG